MELYDIVVKNNKGEDVSLSVYKGKVLLIVNTATHCGYTPQYSGLQELYNKYRERGLEILDFPCNQFGLQAPGTDQEIEQFCSLNYATTFPRFEKIKVNGPKQSELYAFLKQGEFSARIRWNFTKFLIDQAGNVVNRYDSKVKPEEIEKDILALL
jgi:glutathione peroxidase